MLRALQEDYVTFENIGGFPVTELIYDPASQPRASSELASAMDRLRPPSDVDPIDGHGMDIFRLTIA